MLTKLKIKTIEFNQMTIKRQSQDCFMKLTKIEKKKSQKVIKWQTSNNHILLKWGVLFTANPLANLGCADRIYIAK